MSDTLDGLKSTLSNISNSITEWSNRRQGYLDKAAEIQKVYDNLKSDKKVIQNYKKDISDYSNTSFSEFIGNNYEYGYKPQMTDLLSSYDLVIGNIDINLDRLNDEILRQKNLASDCLGPLGELGKAFHTVQTKIENWTN